MLTAFDKALLNVLQTDLPISHRPFADLADILDSDESTVMHRVQELKRDGYLRRIGPFFDSDSLGYQGTLIALQVDPEALPEVAGFINKYPGATHNYEREGTYNLWFTLLTPDKESKKEVLRAIRELPGVTALLDLASHKKYKINVKFDLK